MTTGLGVLVVAVLLLPVHYADAQTPSWPGESRGRPYAPPAWARTWERGVPAVPTLVIPPPITGASDSAEGGASVCTAEFTKLHEEVEQKGIAAQAADQRHAPRKEMCKLITSYAATEARWIDVIEANVQTCRISIRVVNQLEETHANTDRTRVRICADFADPDVFSPRLHH
jgi:hypothetical protein